jgi:predicted peptidase
MRRNVVWLAAIALIVFACAEKEDDVVEPQRSTPNNTEDVETPSGGPAWSQGFPLLTFGATTADLTLQTTTDAKVYYVVTNRDVELSAHDVIREAVSPTLTDIRSSGVVDTKASESIIKTVSKLKEGSRHYCYVVSTPPNDTSKVSSLESINFSTHVRQDTTQFYSNSEKRNVDYLLYKPEEVLKSKDGKFPIIIFLGGQGERAHGNKRINIIQNGLLPEYIHKGNDVPMIVMSVQHKSLVWQNSLITEAFDHAMATLPVDKQRVYLVGTSAGAFGVWQFAEQFPERVTAIVPISGGGKQERACAMRDLAVKAFHNKHDDLVPAEESKKMIDALNDCGPSRPAELQVFPDKGHNCWRRIFDRNHPDWSMSPNVPKVNIYEWLLDKKRSTAN